MRCISAVYVLCYCYCIMVCILKNNNTTTTNKQTVRCLQSVEDYGVVRLGHGYRCEEDERVYQDVLKRGIHFETCPISSIITKGARNGKINHPILRYPQPRLGCTFGLQEPAPEVFILQTFAPPENSLHEKLEFE